ncbi:hypothetical protein AFERRID_22050 [Acidithiobacillus ferridurans]|uniref:Uncharacterized protein n=1 Tax=Acidithiobacillus ferridurans TaxID=1232575 RepID=A0A2Z6IMJ3_ACIFI|nr:hypothetical protein AFERRID_22050 [Acidithiobacillus ferridurans]
MIKYTVIQEYSSLDIQPGPAGFFIATFSGKNAWHCDCAVRPTLEKKGRPMRSVLGFSESLMRDL